MTALPRRPVCRSFAVAFSIPAESTMPLVWWKDIATAQLRDVARAHGRNLATRPRFTITNGNPSTLTATAQTRPAS